MDLARGRGLRQLSCYRSEERRLSGPVGQSERTFGAEQAVCVIDNVMQNKICKHEDQLVCRERAPEIPDTLLESGQRGSTALLTEFI
ncbi:hypothetical protein NQZ68_036572 [Dissostichus eleginoides]|nr:hypothetical protein NQZ68_036572 [Dissostichus eleginoides]